jgi:diguanylate cyclase (GGDEF)-like protein
MTPASSRVEAAFTGKFVPTIRVTPDTDSAPSAKRMIPPRLSRPPLVLLVNDQEWSARSLESMLEPNGFAVLRAYTGRQALELARSAPPDLVILDAHMPDLNGLEVCRMLREQPGFSPTIPIVITTSGPSERSQRLAALAAGAWEFFSQPLDSEILLLKLSTFMRAKLESERVREESLLDNDTGLYNVRGLALRAREIGAEANRRRTPLACVAFAPATASGGHIHSDGALGRSPTMERVGRIFSETGRASDAIGRIGQLEFAIIAPATPAEGAVRLAERLRESVEQIPVEVDGVQRRITLRVGYCAVPDFADSAVDAEEILLRATMALRRAGDQLEEIRRFE